MMTSDEFRVEPSGEYGHQDLPTRHNSYLTRPENEGFAADNPAPPAARNEPSAAPVCAIDCIIGVHPMVEAYVEAGIAPATRRAYHADVDHFRAWGGTIPATDTELAAYIATHAKTLRPATLIRRLAAISVAHDAQGLPNPTRSPLIRATMRGVKRERGRA